MATPVLRRAPRLESLEARDVPATLLVDDDFVPKPSAGRFDTIQSAVDAADPYDTIRVRAGTYAEQVTVGPGKDGVRLLAQGNGVIVTTPANAVSPLAIVDVTGAINVTIAGFTIAGPVTVDDLGAGILIENGGSATISDNRVLDIRTDPLSGDQFGNAIQVGGFLPDGTPTPGRATITGNLVARYQKTGVVVFNPGSSAAVSGNTIVGVGPTDVIAQNGVQVSDGATARVSDNTITGNVYTPAGTEATGILVAEAGAVSVTGNLLFGNEVGVNIDTQVVPILVSGNAILGSTQDGVVVFNSSGVTLLGNRVVGSGRDGVRLDGATKSVIALNSVLDSGKVGLRVVGDSGANLIVFNRLYGSGKFDALDKTSGFGTAGTADLWLFNGIGVTGTPGLS